MVRGKTFDPESAVDAAMRVFWREGYDGASIEDLTQACGIGRGSMYATFGSKGELYDRALEHYQAVEGAWIEDCAGRDAPVGERIAALFERFGRSALEDPENRGCLMLNAAMERAAHDPVIARRVRGAMGDMEELLARLVCEGQATGELDPGLDARRLARYLLAALNGVRVTAKATRDAALVRDAIAVALTTLDRR